MSVEETNRLRISLGLKPLQVEETNKSEVQEAKERLQRRKEEAAKKRKAMDVQQRIAQMRRNRERESTIMGKGLGEADSDEEADQDVLSWVNKSRSLESTRQRERELAERKAAELSEADQRLEEAAAEAVSGLTVAHDLSELGEGETIMVLEDRPVLSEDGSSIAGEYSEALMNPNLAENQRYRVFQERKKRKPVYDPYAEAELAGQGGTRSILPQYDDAPERPSFRLGAGGTVETAGSKEEQLASIREKLNQVRIDAVVMDFSLSD